MNKKRKGRKEVWEIKGTCTRIELWDGAHYVLVYRSYSKRLDLGQDVKTERIQ